LFSFLCITPPQQKENKKTKQKTPSTPLLKHFLVLFFFFLAGLREGRQHKSNLKQTPPSEEKKTKKPS